MDDIKQYSYWMGLAHLPRWRTQRINSLIIKILHENKISLEDFFDMDRNTWLEEFDFSSKELDDLETAKTELPNNSFLIEDMLNQGFDFIPLNSSDYSNIMKNNLKQQYSPPLIYTKGNKQLLQEISVAIVGSRKASKISLAFTKKIAQNAVKEFQVVVSGFAKGVDKTALDETLSAHGKSIIVLPQGITTFSSGFKKYYSQIIEGDVLVLSTFHPKAPWSVGLAMARNVYIYGLAEKIYVAESAEKGGTWSGVMDGLKKEREIFVRIPAKDEKNANSILLMKGAIPIDNEGKVGQQDDIEDFEEKLKSILTLPLSIKDIKEKLSLDINSRKLTSIISEFPFIVKEKRGGRNIFRIKHDMGEQGDLFNR